MITVETSLYRDIHMCRNSAFAFVVGRSEPGYVGNAPRPSRVMYTFAVILRAMVEQFTWTLHKYFDFAQLQWETFPRPMTSLTSHVNRPRLSKRVRYSPLELSSRGRVQRHGLQRSESIL